MEDPKDKLIASAAMARERAYAPYSDFRVGAAVEAEGGEIYIGCNVESASYGLTVCAERVAIFEGVLAGGRKLMHVSLTCRDREGNLVAKIAPCGACLQVIAEFGSAKGPVISRRS